MTLTSKHIAAARALLRLTRDELAVLCDVSPMTILNIENEKHIPTPATLEKIRIALEGRGIEFSNGDGVGVRLRYGSTRDSKPTTH